LVLNNHLDLPYSTDCELPPIFGSQLCHIPPKIHFLYASLPKLDSICWAKKGNDDYEEAAEEALANQYDRNIKNFYLDVREQLKKKKDEK
jgi:hypothetical protein